MTCGRIRSIFRSLCDCSCIRADAKEEPFNIHEKREKMETTATLTPPAQGNYAISPVPKPSVVDNPGDSAPIALAKNRDAQEMTGSNLKLEQVMVYKPATENGIVASQRVSTVAVPYVLTSEQVGYDAVPFPVLRAYNLPLSELESTTLDVSLVSTPCTFRLIDCRRFTKQRTLVIYETSDVPQQINYMAVSYPWVGVVCDERVPPEGKTFQVAIGGSAEIGTDSVGATGDPISISILNRICSHATVFDMNFLWLDKLCVRQDIDSHPGRMDKKWQIERMSNIFKSCTTCMVVPGGLQRLANIYEETPWITRTWTLVEVLAAPKVLIVTNFAPTSLDQFLLGSTDPLYGMRLFGRHRANHRSMLVDALSLRSLEPERSLDLKARYRRYLSIWKCTLARVSSDIADLLPSVMGLFNTLDDSDSLSDTLDNAIVRFKEQVADPHSEDLCAIAFRDAVLYSGLNISPQWEELRSSLLKSLPGKDKLGLRISRPHVMNVIQSNWQALSINKAYEIPLAELENTVLDISSVSTPCIFRLIDCKKYIQEQTMVIYETPDVPRIPYAAVSYPWVGVPCHYFTPAQGKSFGIIQDTGRLGDSISVEVMRLACLLAIKEGADLLWIDRLCIRQLDRQDKSWQIARMCNVYRSCQVCIIVPGGLQRLAGLQEETPWIIRMWTLQEALVPSKSLVLYSSIDGSDPTPTSTLHLTDSAVYTPLEDLLPSNMTQKDNILRLFGHVSYGSALLLRDALSLQGQNLSDEQRYQRYLATWRSAITRSSDRPQDLLLSTMGLFDIQLDEGELRSPETIIASFVKEFRKHGIADVRVVAFRDAVRRAEVGITSQWRQLIEEFDCSLPLLHDGITLIPGVELPLDLASHAVVSDSAGRDIFLGSALLNMGAEHSLHPCKIVRQSPGCLMCFVSYGGYEKEHNGRWELKQFISEQMEWVNASHGQIPVGRMPVEGGYEKDVQYRRQRSLYYALAFITNEHNMQEQVPGKTGYHLGGCCVGFGGKEHFVRENYMVLCWKEGAEGAQKTLFNPQADDRMFWNRPNLPLVSFPGIQADR